MSYFKPLEPEGQVAILVRGGIYKQVPLYTRNGYIFAKSGDGFVRLTSSGATSATSAPATRIESLVMDFELFEDQFGRLCDASVTGAKAIPVTSRRLLLDSGDQTDEVKP